MTNELSEAFGQCANMLAWLKDIELARLGELVWSISVLVVSKKPALLIDSAIPKSHLPSFGRKNPAKADIDEEIINHPIHGFGVDR